MPDHPFALVRNSLRTLACMLVVTAILFGGAAGIARAGDFGDATDQEETVQVVTLDQAAAPPSSFLDWSLLVGVLILLWVLFYWMVYPLLLRYFPPHYCKVLFWCLFLLYALAWIHLSLYVIFPWWGFTYLWLRWVAAFLAVVWLIWFIVAISRRPV